MVDYSYYIANETVISGNTRIFLMDADSIPINGMVIDNAGRVTSIMSYKKWSVIENLETLNWDTEDIFDKNGVATKVTVGFQINGVTQSRQRLQRMFQDETLYTAIIQSDGDKCFLLGQRNPLEITSIKTSISDKNGYFYTLTGNQKTMIREVNNSFVNSILLNDYEVNDSGTGSTILTPGSGSGGGTGSGTGSAFIGVYYPTNNYTITNETFILVTSGNSVYLPLNPLEGRELTIKDGGQGATKNVTVKSAPHTLDGSLTNIIDTDSGSFTAVYANGNWYNKAFTS